MLQDNQADAESDSQLMVMWEAFLTKCLMIL